MAKGRKPANWSRDFATCGETTAHEGKPYVCAESPHEAGTEHRAFETVLKTIAGFGFSYAALRHRWRNDG